MSVFESPAWYNALTLQERASALSSAPGRSTPHQGDATCPNERLKAWRQQPPFDRSDYFTKRLAAEGFSEEDFVRILSEPAEIVKDRLGSRPEWLERLSEAFEAYRVPETRSEQIPRTERLPFTEIAAPILDSGRARLKQMLDLLAASLFVPFDIDSVVEKVALQLGDRLRQIVTRTLVLELNIARLRETLEGETPEDRFRSFLSQLRDPDYALAQLAEYPVLARQMVQAVDHGIAFYLEFLSRLTRDWDSIRDTLTGGEDPGKLEDFTAGVGDTHRQGRSVLIAHFTSGFKLVYKPRPMALDVHFQELLGWLNDRGNEPSFRILRVLNQGEYGWVEFVEFRACNTLEEVSRFYRQQGAYLAVLYALDATDFHTENLIAEGENPVMLDMEALFHARIASAAATSPAQEITIRTLGNSVLRIGLLPHRVLANAESEGIDVSGLGSTVDQMTPHRVPQWQKAETDGMHLGREHVAMPAVKSRPTLDGIEVDILEHVDVILAGFTAMYRLLEQHREDLLSPAGPLCRFAEDEVRVIVRPTQTYGVLLSESFHPDVLRDELDRAQLFDRLWIPAVQLPHLARVIPAEIRDLTQGDIPMFTTRPNSRDLWTCADECLPAFLDEPSLSHVRTRLADFGAKDLERQLWFIRASLATVTKKTRFSRMAEPFQAAGSVGPEELLRAARAVGDELEKRSLQERGFATWVGVTQPGEGFWRLQPLGLDLYDGLPGVTVFLAYLGMITGEDRYTALARSALRALREEISQARDHVTAIGAFAGWGGIIYALTHLGVIWSDTELLDEAKALVDRLPSLIERDEHIDVIGGAAGCIGALLSLYECKPTETILYVARQCGDRLIASAKVMDQGIGWHTPIALEKPLSGFSHGAAGIAWALMKLSTATREQRYRVAALDAIAYERTLFSSEHLNWWDLRTFGSETAAAPPAHCENAWCHGAPGIGLSRIDILEHLDDGIVHAGRNQGINRDSAAIRVRTKSFAVPRRFGKSRTPVVGRPHTGRFRASHSGLFDRPRHRGRHTTQRVAVRQPASRGVTWPDDRAGGDRLRSVAPGRS